MKSSGCNPVVEHVQHAGALGSSFPHLTWCVTVQVLREDPLFFCLVAQ